MAGRNKKREYTPGVTISFRTRVDQDRLIEYLNKSKNVNDDILTALEQYYGLKPKQPAETPALDFESVMPLLRAEMERMISARSFSVVEAAPKADTERSHEISKAETAIVDRSNNHEKQDHSSAENEQAASSEGVEKNNHQQEMSVDEMFDILSDLADI